jgi:hypothetical protein
VIKRLRNALDPEPATFGDIPDFDLKAAYELYREVLLPVENGWKNAKDLIVVASGPVRAITFLDSTHRSGWNPP